MIKRGKRYTAKGSKQLLYCRRCKKTTTVNPDHFKNKTYPVKAIIAAISHYNLGHTLEETSKHINRRFKLKSSQSTVHSWINEFKYHLPPFQRSEKPS